MCLLWCTRCTGRTYTFLIDSACLRISAYPIGSVGLRTPVQTIAHEARAHQFSWVVSACACRSPRTATRTPRAPRGIVSSAISPMAGGGLGATQPLAWQSAAVRAGMWEASPGLGHVVNLFPPHAGTLHCATRGLLVIVRGSVIDTAATELEPLENGSLCQRPVVANVPPAVGTAGCARCARARMCQCGSAAQLSTHDPPPPAAALLSDGRTSTLARLLPESRSLWRHVVGCLVRALVRKKQSNGGEYPIAAATHLLFRDQSQDTARPVWRRCPGGSMAYLAPQPTG